MLVAVRVRPLSDQEASAGHRSCCEVVGEQIIIIRKSGQPGQHLKSQQGSSHEYAFDAVFGPNSSQQTVYASTVKPIISGVLDGFNATVFAYGQTSSGKTHTMMGSERDSRLTDTVDTEGGIIPHAAAEMFSIIQTRREEDRVLREKEGTLTEWKLFASYLEVYNEQIFDLLRPSKPLSLREDPSQGIVHVAGLHSEMVNSADDILQLLRRGNCNRKTEPTAANKVSSRSHAVLQISVENIITHVVGNETPRESVVKAKLCLIDLAGSERASATENRGIRMTEGANINKSLLALANCINALASGTTKRRVSRRQSDVFSMTTRSKSKGLQKATRGPKVQYRDSKLTHLLKTSLEGDCRLVMIANVNPSDKSFEETHNTLKYANRAKNIKVRPRMHVQTAELTHQQRADRLEKENIQLRDQILQLRGNKRESDSCVIFSTPRKRRKLEIIETGNNMISGAENHVENSSLRDKCNDLEMQLKRLTLKNQALEIQLLNLRKMCDQKDGESVPRLRRSSRRSTMLSRVDENTVPLKGKKLKSPAKIVR